MNTINSVPEVNDKENDERMFGTPTIKIEGIEDEKDKDEIEPSLGGFI